MFSNIATVTFALLAFFASGARVVPERRAYVSDRVTGPANLTNGGIVVR